jgi:uncharacterized membrane protein YtjA (UPF0391 family)
MLSWAITFLIIAIVAVLGFGGIAGTATGIAKILFVVFLVMFIASFFFGRRGEMMIALKTLAAALLLGGSALAMAANDGQARANELLSSDPQYRETWQGVVKNEERLPEWVMNLSGTPSSR